jgi:hypothetical protein
MAHKQIKSYQASASLNNGNARIVFQLVDGSSSDSGAIPVANIAAAITVLQASPKCFLTVDTGNKPLFVTNAPDAPGP